MKEHSVKRNIAAPAETVWALLTDAEGYAHWNPAVIGIEGTIAVGQKIKVTSIVNPKRAFALKVSELEEPRKMVWSSGMPLGLFSGIRTYLVTPQGDGSTDFSMEEVFSGLLAPLITKTIPDMTDSFEQFGDGLKEAAEANA
jgi:hypothetical protein